MHPCRGPWLRLFGKRLLAGSSRAVGLSLLVSGCTQFRASSYIAESSLPTLSSPARGEGSALARAGTASGARFSGTVLEMARDGQVVRVSAPESAPHRLPNVATPPAQAAPALAAPEPAPTNTLPIGLDTVFRLAEEQNAQVGLARERLREACADQELAGLKWIPDIYAGTAYYRHEGGIANEDGSLTHSSFGSAFSGLEVMGKLDVREAAYRRVNAQRQVLQQKGELSRVTSETLLEASTTYIDLLTARTGEAVAREIQARLDDLLRQTRDIVSVERPARVEVSRVQAELASQKRVIFQLRQQAAAASAKLIYLLALDPCSQLLPVDGKLLPFELIDATPPVCNLVEQAVTNGPGVHAMVGLLALVQESVASSHGPGRLIPEFKFGVLEGGFGTGPGDEMTWDNRFDVGLQARWNLTNLLTRRPRQQALESKAQQAQFAYQDLRGKLTAGVEEARGAILAGREQIPLAQEQVAYARRAYEKSVERLHTAGTGGSPSEVLLSVEALGRAQMGYLTATNAFDKGQLRLMALLGPQAVIPCRALAPTPAPGSRLPIPAGRGE